jgi:hypothetical protein
MAKKELIDVPVASREANGLSEIKRHINNLMPKTNIGYWVFNLKNGQGHIMPPKTVCTSESGVKLRLRYSKNLNSIFEIEQDTDGFEVDLEHIFLDKNNVVRDQNLAYYLIAHSDFNRKYTLLDATGNAEKELEQLSLFDNVWDKVRSLKEEQLKALLLLDSRTSINEINEMSLPVIRLALRNKASKDPSGLMELINSPLLEPIYLYNMALALGEVKLTKNGILQWVSSGKEICRVPADKDPAMYVAKFLMNADNIGILEAFNEKIHG